MHCSMLMHALSTVTACPKHPEMKKVGKFERVFRPAHLAPKLCRVMNVMSAGSKETRPQRAGMLGKATTAREAQFHALSLAAKSSLQRSIFSVFSSEEL